MPNIKADKAMRIRNMSFVDPLDMSLTITNSLGDIAIDEKLKLLIISPAHALKKAKLKKSNDR